MKKQNSASDYIRALGDCTLDDIKLVGGKNASLGVLIGALTSKGVQVPAGFAVTINGYWDFIYANKLREPVEKLLSGLDRENFSNLRETGTAIRDLVEHALLPENLSAEITVSYAVLCEHYGSNTDVAVRSSATAEDLPDASFAGQHESYLNISGEQALLIAVHKCFVSLFTDRAIKYREDHGFDHMKVGLSVGVQKMVRSDIASSGVIFTLEPESGFRDIVLITGGWGLGENVVQGTISPDEFYVFKPTFLRGKQAIVQKKTGSKAKMLVYAAGLDHQPGIGTSNIDTPEAKRDAFVLRDDEINKLAGWAMLIEQHYKQPMDIEWAKDGFTEELFIVQARPETVQQRRNPHVQKEYVLSGKGKKIAEGNAIGGKIVSGIARVLHDPSEREKLQAGEILVTEIANPDWDPIMKKAAAIITDRGGRTSHAAIVARELGLAAIVGTGEGSKKIRDGQQVTVSCATGKNGVVYEGLLAWEEKEYDLRNITLPKTQAKLIVGDPDQAFGLSFLPSTQAQKPKLKNWRRVMRTKNSFL
ncbi:MAG: pyruvate, water dikinase [Bacteroidetes bacterium]|nr:MAG: pyruvate, water dikinase [Bacteroidota bacterium]